ncbi:MAG: hypothetical protein HOV81_17600 [Kofleriaceae bacterium]|nr:hypothetical protein [Kofleriaceae bacterium]
MNRSGARVVVVAVLVLSACATTTKLDRVVVAYDRTTTDGISKLLLLNIARARFDLPMHFTTIANVTATYRFTANGGVMPSATGGKGWLPAPFLNGSVEESPTVSIAPMQGDEFTQRLLTPFPEQKLTLLLRQGYDVDALLRLLGAEIRVATSGKKAPVIFSNRPANRQGYTMFRRIIAHISSIQDRHGLYVEPLHYEHEWTVPEDAVTPETFEKTYKNFTVMHDPMNHVYRVSNRVSGRVIITNYDPALLTNEEQFALHGEANEVPFNDVLVDIRPEYIGGEYPIHAVLRLRSFHEILKFLGRDLGEDPEYDVPLDPRTPKLTENPAHALAISETRHSPGGLSVELNGFHYSVRQQRGYQWNKKAFDVLYQLYQMSVTPVPNTGPGITIAK